MPTQLTLGNGATEKRFFSSRLRPIQVTLQTTVGGSVLMDLKAHYCPGTTNACAGDNGNVMSQTETWGTTPSQFAATTAYTYDGLNRLTQATESAGAGTGWSQRFGYDSFGNRWVTSSSTAPTYETPQGIDWYRTPAAAGTYNTTNRIRKDGWIYDAAGNITQVGLMSRSFAYDAENRQITAVINVSGRRHPLQFSPDTWFTVSRSRTDGPRVS